MVRHVGHTVRLVCYMVRHVGYTVRHVDYTVRHVSYTEYLINAIRREREILKLPRLSVMFSFRTVTRTAIRTTSHDIDEMCLIFYKFF